MASVTEAKNVAPKAVSAAAVHASGALRNDWKREEIQEIFDSPLMDLLFYGVRINLVKCISWEIKQDKKNQDYQHRQIH